LTSEERWGWRFAVAWRLAIACLMGVYFVVQLLIKWKVMVLDDGSNMSIWGFSAIMLEAVLLISMIVAIASAPRFTRRGAKRSWSWAVELLGYIASVILCAILLMDSSLVTVLVHMAIAGMTLASPLALAPDVLATYGSARIAWFFDVTTAGVVSVVVSCGLLRLLSFRWWRGGRQRIYAGVLLAASLAITILLAGRIVLVEVPGISPILAANIVMPTPSQLTIAAVLTLMFVSAAARRWSEPPSNGFAIGSGFWRREEQRYYHEHRILVFLLAGVLLAQLVGISLDLAFNWEWMGMGWCSAFYWLETPQGYLSLALIFLAVESVFSGRSECAGTAPAERPRLAPGLFLLIWSALLQSWFAACQFSLPGDLFFGSACRDKYACYQPVEKGERRALGAMPTLAVGMAPVPIRLSGKA